MSILDLEHIDFQTRHDIEFSLFPRRTFIQTVSVILLPLNLRVFLVFQCPVPSFTPYLVPATCSAWPAWTRTRCPLSPPCSWMSCFTLEGKNQLFLFLRHIHGFQNKLAQSDLVSENSIFFNGRASPTINVPDYVTLAVTMAESRRWSSSLETGDAEVEDFSLFSLECFSGRWLDFHVPPKDELLSKSSCDVKTHRYRSTQRSSNTQRGEKHSLDWWVTLIIPAAICTGSMLACEG